MSESGIKRLIDGVMLSVLPKVAGAIAAGMTASDIHASEWCEGARKYPPDDVQLAFGRATRAAVEAHNATAFMLALPDIEAECADAEVPPYVAKRIITKPGDDASSSPGFKPDAGGGVESARQH